MNTQRQKGFTLIELMVVVAIVAVLLAVATLSLGGRDHQQQRQQWTQIQSMLQMACDQAAFHQRIYLVAVTEQGLQAYRRQSGDWLPTDMKTVKWAETFQVEWQLDSELQEAWQLPQPGWLCWPNGLVSEGEIRLLSTAHNTPSSEQRLRWDEELNFVFEN